MSQSKLPNPGDSSRPEGTPRPDGTQVPRCAAAGHEQLPAAAIGILADGDQATPEVPYCADCAQLLAAAGEYTITEALDQDALGSTVCPHCHGAGRLPRPHAGVVATAGQAANTSPAGHDQAVGAVPDPEIDEEAYAALLRDVRSLLGKTKPHE